MKELSLFEKDQRYIWHPFTPMAKGYEPLVITKAKDCYLYTEDGRKILDAIASWWLNLHGHGNKYLAQAISRQAEQLEHIIFAGFTHEPAIDLAERLLQILPSNQSRIFYSDNGSTSVEVGLKMAIQYFHNQDEKKTKIVALEGAYHGDTFGSMAVGERGTFNAAYEAFLFEVAFIDFPHQGNFEQVKKQFEDLVSKGDVAAFLFEPLVQGAGGMRMYSAEHLDELVGIAQQHNVICIADEVMTGFGRTGKDFACLYLQNQPDIMCLSKGLTGGAMAMGATSCSDKIVQAFRSENLKKTFFHSHSYAANPLACAVGNASLDLYLKEECQQNRLRIGEQHQVFLEKHRNHPKIREMRRQGVILAIEIENEDQTSYFNNERNRLYNFFMERNILMRPLGNIIYILPPYIITNEELNTIYEAILELLNEHL